MSNIFDLKRSCTKGATAEHDHIDQITQKACAHIYLQLSRRGYAVVKREVYGAMEHVLFEHSTRSSVLVSGWHGDVNIDHNGPMTALFGAMVVPTNPASLLSELYHDRPMSELGCSSATTMAEYEELAKQVLLRLQKDLLWHVPIQDGTLKQDAFESTVVATNPWSVLIRMNMARSVLREGEYVDADTQAAYVAWKESNLATKKRTNLQVGELSTDIGAVRSKSGDIYALLRGADWDELHVGQLTHEQMSRTLDDIDYSVRGNTAPSVIRFEQQACERLSTGNYLDSILLSNGYQRSVSTSTITYTQTSGETSSVVTYIGGVPTQVGTTLYVQPTYNIGSPTVTVLQQDLDADTVTHLEVELPGGDVMYVDKQYLLTEPHPDTPLIEKLIKAGFPDWTPRDIKLLKAVQTNV